MQLFKWVFLISTLLVLASCGPQVEIQGDVEESQIILDEERQLLSFYVRLENTSNLPSGDLFAKFEILSSELIEALGQETIPFVDKQQVPQAFTVSANSGYFIGEAFEIEQSFSKEELTDAVEVVIFDKDGEDVTRFIINNVEMESN